ncbi:MULTISPECIES: DUF3558 domain-containing protein [unclassified Nocardia]|uniref:DUF3558 domain-containing protein n=1 Tax=unclassified Nocardia TaxID=2637762 RepID=UPI001CE47189|nr:MULTISPECIES: DUF3558 domain-containing protein [unclassified Nocardia]
MRAVTRVFLLVVLGAGPFLAGCGSSTDGTPQSSTPATTSTASGSGLAADAPTGYNPCTDVPQSVLDSEKLHKAVTNNRSDLDGPGGVKWRGCGWVRSNGYAVDIRVTNLTIPYIRGRGFADTRDLTIGGRKAISTRREDSSPSEVCSINVEIKGGSLEFGLDNPPSRRETGATDTCQLGMTLAEKVVATLPAGV